MGKITKQELAEALVTEIEASVGVVSANAIYETERIIVSAESNQIAHSLTDFSKDSDFLQVYVNSVYAVKDVYYALNDNFNITKISGDFGVGDIIDLIRVRLVPNVEIANAIDIDYDNSTSGLSATRVQGAIDEVNNKINIYEDQGTDPNFTGIKYKLVMINGEAFMEVVES